MFTTTSHLTNLCIAGINLDSYLTNPIFWVACLVAFIILIILIRTIIKHARYSIKFVSNGGTRVRKVRAAKGEYFVMPADPVRPNYVFAGWYYEDKEWNFETDVVNGNVTLVAKWDEETYTGPFLPSD